MADKNGFRFALGGFNKADVLDYIDSVTAAWNDERRDLNTQLESIRGEADTQRAAAQESFDRLQSAASLLKTKEEENARLQDQLTFQLKKAEACTARIHTLEEQVDSLNTQLEVYRRQLEEADTQVRELQETLEQLTNQRDEAIAAVADARLEEEEKTAAAMEEADRRLSEKDSTITALQEQVAAAETEKTALAAKAAHARCSREEIDRVVTPILEDNRRRTEDTIDSLQHALGDMLTQLQTMQQRLEERREALGTDTAKARERLDTAFGFGRTPSASHTPAADPAARFFQ